MSAVAKNYQNYPCRKLVEFILLNNRKAPWKIGDKILVERISPSAKKYITNWTKDNLHGPTLAIVKEAIMNIVTPITIIPKYKKIDKDLWMIINEPTIREIIEIEIVLGSDINEIYSRITEKIKPRAININAIRHYRYYIWNLINDSGKFEPQKLINVLKASKALYSHYKHVFAYYDDHFGKAKYLIYYNLIRIEEPNTSNLISSVNLNNIEIISAFKEGDIERVESLSKILLNNSKSLKTLKSITNNKNDIDLSDILYTLESNAKK